MSLKLQTAGFPLFRSFRNTVNNLKDPFSFFWRQFFPQFTRKATICNSHRICNFP
nr:MAG TPA: hypothetical protein [Caudoviricetes sp.]